MRSDAVWCIRPSRLSRSLNQMCSCELRWNWTSTQFGVDFREMTMLTADRSKRACWHFYWSCNWQAARSLSVYRGKTQWLSAAAEGRPKVRSWPSAETERSPKQYTSLLSAPKPNFSRSLVRPIRIWIFFSFRLESPIHGPKISVFGGFYTPKFRGTSVRPPKHTSLSGTTRFEPSLVQIGGTVGPVALAKKPKKKNEKKSGKLAICPDHPRRHIDVKICMPGGLSCVVLYFKFY